MPYVITKDFAFSASHVLTGLRDSHPCGRLHGHNYTVRVEVSDIRVDATGFVLDYGDLAPFGRWLDDHLDHRHLNDAFPDMQPSAENLAASLADVLRSLLPDGTFDVAVGVSETPKTWAWWRPMETHRHG